MSMIKTLARRAVAALLLAAAAAHAHAHEYWILPSRFDPAVGEEVGVGLRVGSGWPGESRSRDLNHLLRFGAVDASGERPIPGEHAQSPAGSIAPRRAGATWLVYRSRATDIEIDPKTFELYLREEGLESVIDERARRGESARPGREAFTRHAKALLRVGARGDGASRRVGLALEIVAEHDPAARAPGEPLRLRLLLRGRPLTGMLVKAQRRPDAPGTPSPWVTARTDGEGRVALPIEQPGVWLVNAVQMRRAPPGRGHDWESLWSSLTFEMPAR
jgi:hypothetical protein